MPSGSQVLVDPGHEVLEGVHPLGGGEPAVPGIAVDPLDEQVTGIRLVHEVAEHAGVPDGYLPIAGRVEGEQRQSQLPGELVAVRVGGERFDIGPRNDGLAVERRALHIAQGPSR